MERVPMSRREFRFASRKLQFNFPGLVYSGGARSVERNKEVGGNSASKHLHHIDMAHDFTRTRAWDVLFLDEAAEYAIDKLGLWAIVHNSGSGMHLHIQGLPKGPPTDKWIEDNQSTAKWLADLEQ